MLICQCNAMHRRDVVCAGGAAMFTAIVATLMSSSKPNRYFNAARGAILRASHPARHHQVLPGIRRGTARLPPLPSLVVVVKPGSRAAHIAPEAKAVTVARMRARASWKK